MLNHARPRITEMVDIIVLDRGNNSGVELDASRGALAYCYAVIARRAWSAFEGMK
jgi:hypothetical protein